MTSTLSHEIMLGPLARERASLLFGLHLLQRHDGYVSLEGMRALANHIRVPAVEVHAAASTYSELRFALAPAGLRRICTGLACRLNGADQLLEQARGDGKPVEEVACFFACGVAPLIEIGEPLKMVGRVQHTADPADHQAVRATARGATGARSGAAILVGGGSCGHAVGAGELIVALRRLAGATLDVVETGCNGACWAQPIVSVRLPDGQLQVVTTNAEADPGPLLRTATELIAEGRSDQSSTAVESWLNGQDRRVLERCGSIDPGSLDEYRERGGYLAWGKVRDGMRPDAVRELVAASGLLGRGGAYFPAARKWETAINSPGEVYLVVNLEEGEPGVFKDRHLCEGDPHAVVEGTLLAAYALQASRVYVYINGQADRTAERISTAFQQAVAEDLAPNGPSITFIRGAGGYVCGEESVILNSIEGYRAVPRLRPPFPAEAGLWGHPTVINNAETLANIPLIVRHGAGWFRSTGTEQAPGTKLLCLAGALPRPGLVEVPFGRSLRQIVEGMGGVVPGETVTLVMGGPSGGFMPARLLDAGLLPGVMDPAGAILGAGGVTVVDGSIAPLEVARQLTAYNAAESCGKCTPCREGTARTEAILARALANTADAPDRELLNELNETIRLASLCGLGQAAPNPVTSLLAHFPPAALRGTVEDVKAGSAAGLARAEAEPGA